MAEDKKYYIRVPEALVEVNKDVYLTFFRARRRWYAQSERDKNNGLVSYDGMDTEDTLGEDMIPDRDAPSVEDAAIANILRSKLYHCLTLLDEPDRRLIRALYFEGMSERKYAKRVGIPQQTISDRKRRVLAELKKLLEN